MLNLIFLMILFVLFVSLLFADATVFFLLLPPVVGLFVPFRNPLSVLLLFVRILVLLLKKSRFMTFL